MRAGIRHSRPSRLDAHGSRRTDGPRLERCGASSEESSLLGKQFLDGAREDFVGFSGDRSVFDFRAGGEFAEVVVALPVPDGPKRPRREAAAAVRTHVAKNLGHARGAERALEAAYPCLERAWGKQLVAVFASGTEFEHGDVRVPGTDLPTGGQIRRDDQCVNSAIRMMIGIGMPSSHKRIERM